MSANFHQLFFAFIFMSGKPQLVCLVPLAVRAMLLAMAFANKVRPPAGGVASPIAGRRAPRVSAARVREHAPVLRRPAARLPPLPPLPPARGLIGPDRARTSSQRYAENALWQKYGKGKAYAYVEQNLMKLMQLVALVEVSLSALLVFDLFSGLGRGLGRVFMYFHWLKLKYKVRTTRVAEHANAHVPRFRGGDARVCARDGREASVWDGRGASSREADGRRSDRGRPRARCDATRTEQFEQFKYGNSGNVQMYHTHVWRQIDQAIVVPAVARFPALQRGVDLATGWFNK